MSIRNFNNTSVPQTIQNVGGINSTQTGILVGDNSSYPPVPFTLGLERGTDNQEVVECTALSGTTGFIVTRGFDGSPYVSHDQGASVELTSAAIDYAEANAFINLMDTVGDLLVVGGSGAQRLGVGANGTALTADSSQGTGLNWVQPVPAGVCAHTAAAAAPAGWLLRDGSAVSRTTYANLFAQIGTTYGSGDGSTTFNVPNAINRFDVGSGGSYSLASTGGATETAVTIDTNNMPSHYHSNSVNVGGIPVGAGIEVVVYDPGSTIITVTTGSGGFGVSYTTTPSIEVTVDSTGSGLPFDVAITNPYQALTPIIKF